MKNSFFVLLFILPLAFAFQPSQNTTSAECGAPENVKEIASTDTSYSFEWNAVDGAAGYQVYYTRAEDDFTSEKTAVTTTSHTFKDLSPGTYTFFFATDCGGKVSKVAVVESVLEG